MRDAPARAGPVLPVASNSIRVGTTAGKASVQSGIGLLHNTAVEDVQLDAALPELAETDLWGKGAMHAREDGWERWSSSSTKSSSSVGKTAQRQRAKVAVALLLSARDSAALHQA